LFRFQILRNEYKRWIFSEKEKKKNPPENNECYTFDFWQQGDRAEEVQWMAETRPTVVVVMMSVGAGGRSEIAKGDPRLSLRRHSFPRRF
jgi:hypothetical protein